MAGLGFAGDTLTQAYNLASVAVMAGTLYVEPWKVRSSDLPAEAAELEPVEVGMLRSDRAALLAALTELTMSGMVTIRDRSVHVTASRGTRPGHPAVAEVLRILSGEGATPLTRVETGTSAVRSTLRADMVRRGHLRQQLPGWGTLPALLTAAVGALGIISGVLLPVAFCGAAMCGVVGIGYIVRMIRTDPSTPGNGTPTSRGRAVFRDTQDRYRHLDPHHRPAAGLYGPREMAMAAALFGHVSVDPASPDLAAEFRDVRRAPMSGRSRFGGVFSGGAGVGAPGYGDPQHNSSDHGSSISDSGGSGGGCGGGGAG